MQKNWIVHKFGGTSVGSAERYRNVSRIIGEDLKRAPDNALGVVVSAMKGVTDGLIDAVQFARQKNDRYLELMSELKARHFEAVELLGIPELKSVFDDDFQKLGEVLKGAWHSQSASETIVEFVSGHGEVWSAQILTAFFNSQGVGAKYLDAREILVVETGERVSVDWAASQSKLDSLLSRTPETGLFVITGFVASTPEGVATTLKRNGSDYSASIFGKLFHAREIIIWTDVDGVLSADPRLVPDAKVLSEMSYDEVTELANFGAKVIHPSTMGPAIQANIPVWIRNTFNSSFPGTKIHAHAKSEGTIKGFSAIENMALINVEGTGLVGIPGVAERLFGAMRSAGISVVMISQASSEHSICFAIAEKQAPLAKASIEKAFYAEIHQGALDRIEVIPNVSIVAAVGDSMVERPGVAGQFFTALGQVGVNIHAIAQGASERNISAVIDGSKTKLALQSVHRQFQNEVTVLELGVVGTGLIGKEFLNQLAGELESLEKNVGLKLVIRAITNSKKMCFAAKSQSGIPSAQWVNAVNGAEALPLNLDEMTEFLKSSPGPVAILDLTASDEVPGYYSRWLQAGIHIITPNKKANAAPIASYQNLRAIASKTGRKFFYSTNVCAGLPVLQTARDLYQSGDRLIELQAVLSGTLSYLFNSFQGNSAFSELVMDAKAKGFTEPDPREDLSGQDVARKLVILAREFGIPLELKDIHVESLVPESLKNVSVDVALSQLAALDLTLKEKWEEASSRGEVLRYVGEINDLGKARVQLKAFPKSHPIASLMGADNFVSFKTQRYSSRPLVIQGPGAGAAVTAAGVLGDVLRLAALIRGTKP